MPPMASTIEAIPSKFSTIVLSGLNPITEATSLLSCWIPSPNAALIFLPSASRSVSTSVSRGIFSTPTVCS